MKLEAPQKPYRRHYPAYCFCILWTRSSIPQRPPPQAKTHLALPEFQKQSCEPAQRFP